MAKTISTFSAHNLAYTLFGIILVHLGAALLHGLIYRDFVLGSMVLR